MANWWAEQWSFGSGSSRVSCGVSRTDEGYVVDVVHGDTSVESFVYPSREEAMRVAEGLKLYYRETAIAGRRGHA